MTINPSYSIQRLAGKAFESQPFPSLRGLDAGTLLRGLTEDFSNESVIYFEREESLEVLVGLGAMEEIVFLQNGVRVTRRGSPSSFIEGDPVEILKQRRMAHRIEGDSVAGFSGGYFGVIDYDFIGVCEPRLRRREGNLGRLAPDHEYGTFTLFETIVAIEKKGAKNVRMIHESNRPVDSGVLQACQRALNVPVLDRLPVDPNEDLEFGPSEFKCIYGKERFKDGVKRVKSFIREGDIFQAVVSERFSRSFEGAAEILFLRVKESAPAPYLFFVRNRGRVLMGASPETLVQVKGDVAEAHPIAGTRPFGRNPVEQAKRERQLNRSEKEKAEHLMLVDLARNDLGRVSEPGTVEVASFMKTKIFPGVVHLVSRVVGRVKVDSLDALRACFPAGTLSGAPKIRAMEIISELEVTPRGEYGGAVVLAEFDGDLDSCITIRSLKVENGEVSLQAGAGIVFDSNPEREYLEILHKTKVLRQVLARFESAQAVSLTSNSGHFSGPAKPMAPLERGA